MRRVVVTKRMIYEVRRGVAAWAGEVEAGRRGEKVFVSGS